MQELRNMVQGPMARFFMLNPPMILTSDPINPYTALSNTGTSVIIFKRFQWIGNEIHWINPANTAKIQPIQPKFEKSSGLA